MSRLTQYLSSRSENQAATGIASRGTGPMTDDEKRIARSALTGSEKPIDVRELMRLYSVDELSDTAEEYYAGSKDWSGLLAKPFVCLQETPELLICFAHLLHGLKPVAGMDILDFGAGPGWASHALTSLGAKVIVSDVSETALKIAAERYKRFPISVQHTPPRYTRFNGHRFDLPDSSVDRIVCIDAFHHIPNPNDVIVEMARILRDGGVAAFAEPGPQHSWSPGAQYEMKNHKVVENDVVIEDIWKFAKAAGFGDLKLSVFGTTPFHVGLDQFNDFLKGGRTADQALEGMRHYMQNSRRLFFLTKCGVQPRDSRCGEDLRAEIVLSEGGQKTVRAGEKFKLRVTVKNAGGVLWLPPSHGIGSIWLGMHLHRVATATTVHGHFVHPLPIEGSNGLLPQKSVTFEIELEAMPEPGRYVLEFDMVAQQIAWFQPGGSPTIRFELQVA